MIAPLRRGALCVLLLSSLAFAGCDSDASSRADTGAETAGADAAAMPAAERQGEASPDGHPYVQAQSPVEAGRYLAVVGGCNDCHTEGYLQSEGNVPEEQWLAGSRLGWRGPWGTTYATNLRLRVGNMTEEEWVEQLHTRHANPPMPWMNVNQMSDRDARALYRYIQRLGPTGEPVPTMVPPDREPATPYISLTPENMPAEQAGM